MSTFHQSKFAAYKIKNRNIVEQAPREVLEKMYKYLAGMSSQAILLEQLVLRELPKFNLKTDCNEPIYFTTIIVALMGIIEQELQVRDINEDNLFSHEDY